MSKHCLFLIDTSLFLDLTLGAALRMWIVNSPSSRVIPSPVSMFGVCSVYAAQAIWLYKSVFLIPVPVL